MTFTRSLLNCLAGLTSKQIAAELSHSLKFRIGVETLRNRAKIVRNRSVPVCGYNAGYFGLGLAQLWAHIRLEIEDFRPDPLN